MALKPMSVMYDEFATIDIEPHSLTTKIHREPAYWQFSDAIKAMQTIVLRNE